MYRIKKLTMLMTGVILLGLAGCSTAPDLIMDRSGVASSPAPTKELSFWTFYSAGSREQNFFVRLAEQYNKQNPEIKIRLQSMSFNDYLGDKLISRFAAGEGPDIFLVAPPTFLKYYNAGILKNLTPYIPPESLADFMPESLQTTMIHNMVYGIPYEQDLLGVFYDKDLFARANLDVPRTWDELLQAASRLKTANRAGLSLEMQANTFQIFMFAPFLWSAGGDILTQDRKHSSLSSPQMQRTLEFWRDLMQAGVLKESSSRESGKIGLLGEGETAMQVTGSWDIVELEEIYKNKRVGVFPIPAPDGGAGITAAGGWRIAVNNNSELAEDAAKFVVWAFANEVPSTHMQWDTEVKFAFPVRKSVLTEADEIYKKGLRKTFAKQMLPTARTELRLPPEAYEILQDMIQQTLYKPDKPITDIMDEHDRLLERFLEQYGGAL